MILIFWFILITVFSWSNNFAVVTERIDENEFSNRNNEKVTVECYLLESSDFFTKLESYPSIKELCLEGFSFSGENAGYFSQIVGKLNVERLVLLRCDINDNIAGLLSVLPSMRFIRLEQLNLSIVGIQTIIKGMPLSLESLEIVNCFGDGGNGEKVTLDLARFPLLKRICLERLNWSNFNASESLALLSSPESIRLCDIPLSESEWNLVVQEWYSKKDSFLTFLKEFHLKIRIICKSVAVQLVQLALSSPTIEVFSFRTKSSFDKIHLPSLPQTIRQFTLEGFDEIYLRDDKTSIYNPEFLSRLTHLTIFSEFQAIPPIELSYLEYLDISNIRSQDFLLTSNYFYKMKHLSLHSSTIAPFLQEFNWYFPLLKNLTITAILSSEFDFQLQKILSSVSLKYLQLIYFRNNTKHISLIESVCWLEELHLEGVSFEFVSYMMNRIKFPSLKKINLKFKEELLKLSEILEKLKPLSQLTTLILLGDFYQHVNEESSVKFVNLKFLRLSYCSDSIDLNYLVGFMPNLIELELLSFIPPKIKLKSPIGIRYLSVALGFHGLKNISINFIKNMPSLVRLTNLSDESWKEEIQTADLAYFLKMIKNHFDDEFLFDIQYNCLPILLFKKDKELFDMVHHRSIHLAPFFQQKFPLGKNKEFVRMLFTIEIKEDSLDIQQIDFSFLHIFRFISELGFEIDNFENVLFVKPILESDKKRKREKGIDEYSVDRFYDLFFNWLIKSIGVEMEDYQLRFVKQFTEINKQRGILIIAQFMQSLFTSLLTVIKTDKRKQNRFINSELFSLFAENILANSFRSLIDKIRDKQLSEEVEKQLFSLFPIDYLHLSIQLQFITIELYSHLISNIDNLFFKFDGRPNLIERAFFNLKILSQPESSCTICLDLLFDKGKRVVFFKCNNGKYCHLFHQQCLELWTADHKTCPNCRELGY